MKKLNFDEARREEAVKLRPRQMPVRCRGIYRRAVSGRSLRAAIDAFCQECVGYQRREVTLCTDLGCPLFTHRPKYEVADGVESSAGVSTKAHNGPLSRAEPTNAEKVARG